MYIDKQNLFSSDQAITASAASTNYIDLQAAGDADTELFLVVKTGTAAFATGTSLTIALQTDDNSSFSSATTLFTTAAIVTASLTANKVLVKARIPRGLERYLRLYFTVAGSDYTAGAITAFLTPGIDANP